MCTYIYIYTHTYIHIHNVFTPSRYSTKQYSHDFSRTLAGALRMPCRARGRAAKNACSAQVMWSERSKSFQLLKDLRGFLWIFNLFCLLYLRMCFMLFLLNAFCYCLTDQTWYKFHGIMMHSGPNLLWFVDLFEGIYIYIYI